MKRFAQRLVQSLSSNGYKKRLIKIAEILSFVQEYSNSDSEEFIEQKFISEVASKCGFVMDWKPNFEEFKENFKNIATIEETVIIESIPETAWVSNQEIVATLKMKMRDNSGERVPVLIESLGDFCHFILVPLENLETIESAAGGWLIDT